MRSRPFRRGNAVALKGFFCIASRFNEIAPFQARKSLSAIRGARLTPRFNEIAPFQARKYLSDVITKISPEELQ